MKRHIVKFVIAVYSFYIKGVSVFSGRQAGLIASEIFKKPRGKKLYPKHIEWLNRYKVGYIKWNNQSCVKYHIPGNGRKILLAHGWESNSYRWRKYVEALTQLDYDIYLIDAPGHGLSEGDEFTPPMYGEAMNKLCHEIPIEIIVGHSAGGHATMYAVGALAQPKSVQKIILLAPTNKLRAMMGRFFDVLSLNQKTRNNFETLFVEKYGGTFEKFDGENMIKDSPLEGIIIHDTDDDILPVQYSYDLEKVWKNGKLVVTNGFGHRLIGSAIMNMVVDYIDKGTVPKTDA